MYSGSPGAGKGPWGYYDFGLRGSASCSSCHLPSAWSLTTPLELSWASLRSAALPPQGVAASPPCPAEPPSLTQEGFS